MQSDAIYGKMIMSKNKSIAYIGILLVMIFVGVLCVKSTTFASWEEDENGKRYEKEDGTYATGFYFIEDDTYYFDEEGYLVTGKFYVEEQDAYYYADEDGLVQYGTIDTEDLFYITDEQGRLRTGFVEHQNKRYYFNDNAFLLKGWFLLKGDWYYADDDGVLQSGFVEYQGYRYYLDENNIRVSDTVMVIDNQTYVFSKDGSVDENATTLYPVFQYLNEVRNANQQKSLTQNHIVQTCAIIRAAELKSGFDSSNEQPDAVKKLLQNRKYICLGGYEFSYGGMEDYGIKRLIADMEKDEFLQNVLKEEDITEVGLGFYREDGKIYYDVIITKTEQNEKE